MQNILIIGSDNDFRTALAERFQREGGHVYILSSAPPQNKQSKVRYYTYAYSSSSIRDIYLSCRPDTVLFMGAYDSCYDWSEKLADRTRTQYTADLANLLYMADITGVHRFLYFSSEIVFETSGHSLLTEQDRAGAQNSKAAAVLLGESMTAHYALHTTMDAITIRLDNVYYPVSNTFQCTNALTAFCFQALTTGNVHVNTKITRSALYVNDAVQAVFLLAAATTHKQSLYHVASAEYYTEDQLVDYLQKQMSSALRVQDCTPGLSCRHALNADRFFTEFGFSIHCTLNQYLPQTIRQMQRHSSGNVILQQSSNSRYRQFFCILFPFMESTVFFLLVTLLQWYTQRFTLFDKLDFYLLYVFLLSSIYGVYQAIYASVLSCLGYFVLHSVHGGMLQLMLDGSSYLWVAQLFITGMATGNLRDRNKQIVTDDTEEIRYLKDKLDDISKINDSNVELKNYFEERVINNTGSLGFVYSIVRQLDATPENEMVFVSIQVLVRAMHTSDAAIYSIANAGYCRLKASTSARARALGKSVRMDDAAALFNVIKEKKVFVNRELSPQLPSMAVALLDDENTMQYVILLWDMPYERMTQDAANMFRLLSLLIYQYIHRAMRYLDAIAHARYVSGTTILDEQPFRELVTIYSKATSKGLATASLLHISGLPYTLREADRQLRQLFRHDDLIGLINRQYFVLLPNTDQDEAALVSRRLAEKGLRAEYLPCLPEARSSPPLQKEQVK